jgi:hypothetical protein
LPLELERPLLLERDLLLLLVDRDFLWGILPSPPQFRESRLCARGLPESRPSHTHCKLAFSGVQIGCSAGKSRATAGTEGAAGTEAKRGDNHGPDNAILEQAVDPQPLEFE